MSRFGFRHIIEPAANIRIMVYRHKTWERVGLLKLAGYLDNGNTPAFLKECRAIVAADDLVIGLDLAGLSYMSSTGVGAVSALALDARKSGRLFYLCNVPEKIDRVLSLLGFRESLTVIDNPLAFDFAPYVD